MADPKQVQDIIAADPAERTIKRQAWDDFFSAESQEQFNQKFLNSKLSDDTKRKLMELRFAPPGIDFAAPGPVAPAKPSETGRPFVPPTGREVAGMAVESLPYIGAGLATAAMPQGTPLWLSLLGIGTAGAAGQAARHGIVAATGTEALSGPVVQTPPPPGTPGEFVGDIAKEGGKQVLYDLAGRPIAAAVRGLIGGPLHQAASTPENLPVKEASEKFGLKLTGPEIAAGTPIGRFFRLGQRMGEYSVFSQKNIELARQTGAENALAGINQMLDTLHPATSPLETGESFRRVVEMANTIYDRTASRLYAALDRQSAGIMVGMRGMKAEAGRILNRINQAKGVYPTIGSIGTKAEKILDDIVSGPDYVPFQVAHDIRSNLLKITPQPDELMAEKAQGIAKQMVKTLTGAMENSAQAMNPRALRIWQIARNFYKEGAELFDSATINGLMDRARGPELVAKAIKPGAEETASRIRSAILDYPMRYGTPGDKAVAKATYRQFLEQFVRSNLLSDPEHIGEQFAIEQLPKLNSRIKAMGPRVLGTLFQDPDAQIVMKNLRAIGESMSRIEKLPIEGRRYVYDLMRLFGGAVTGGYLAHGSQAVSAAEGAVTFEALPLLITRAMHNDQATGYLVDGIGGLVSSFKPSAMKTAGKAIRKIQEETIERPAAVRFSGPIMSNFFRAWDLAKKDTDKFQKQRSRENAKFDPFANPYLTPEAGNGQNPYR